SRSPIGRSCERGVSPAPTAAPGHEHPLPHLRQVRHPDQPIVAVLVDDGAGRHFEFEIRTIASGAIRALSVLTTLCAIERVVPVVEKRVPVGTGDQVDGTAPAAVAAAGAAARDAGLAAEGQAAIAAGPRLDLNVDLVDEHGLEGAASGACGSAPENRGRPLRRRPWPRSKAGAR